MTEDNVYNYLIIGSSIAGLYFGYKLKQLNINNFIICERNNRMGKKVGNINF